MKTVFLMGVAALALMVSPAMAEDKTVDAPNAAKAPVASSEAAKIAEHKVDTNGDDKISLAEATAAADKQFEMYDKNHDGKITPDEFIAHMTLVGPKGEKPTMEQIKGAEKLVLLQFGRLDTDKSKDISKAEFEADAAKRHAAMDANKDGFVTKDEVAAFRQKLADFKAQQLKAFREKVEADKKVSAKEGAAKEGTKGSSGKAAEAPADKAAADKK